MRIAQTLEETVDNLRLPLTDEQRGRLLAVVRNLMEQERARAVAVCRRRAGLWENTDLAKSEVPTAREEARARANEAVYLADLIAGL